MGIEKKTANWKVKQRNVISPPPPVFKKPLRIPTVEKLVKLKPVPPKCKIKKCQEVDKNYLHIQDVPAQTWYVEHNLQKYPSVTVMLPTGQVGYGDVVHIDKNNLTITFTGDESGKASIN